MRNLLGSWLNMTMLFSFGSCALVAVAGCSSSSANHSDASTDAPFREPPADALADARTHADAAPPRDASTEGSRDASPDQSADSGASKDGASPPIDGNADAGADADKRVIELQVGDVPDSGMPVVTVQISIGGSPPFTAIVDTGSVGLHVVEGTVPESAWTVTTTATTTTYGTGVITDGFIANGVVTVGGLTTGEAIAMTKITQVSCVASKPHCEAEGEAASAYRYRGVYPANIGIGMRASAAENLASPLAQIGNDQRYVLEIPAFGGTVGRAVIDPTAAEISRFSSTLVQLTSNGAATMSGVASWDDTKVPYCLNSFCAGGLLDTGATSATINPVNAAGYTKIGVADDATSVPSGTLVKMAIDTNATWSFTVGSPPVEGKDVINLADSMSGTDNLSIAPFYIFDLFYDYHQGQIGLAPKP